MTIYDIKRLTAETEPYFFSRQTMKFFNQTLRDFKVKKQSDNKYLIIAPSKDCYGNIHYTKRLFNPENNKLEFVNEAQ